MGGLVVFETLHGTAVRNFLGTGKPSGTTINREVETLGLNRKGVVRFKKLRSIRHRGVYQEGDTPHTGNHKTTDVDEFSRHTPEEVRQHFFGAEVSADLIKFMLQQRSHTTWTVLPEPFLNSSEA